MGLTANQHDALTEILNIAIGRAAHSLNQMVHEEVILSVPDLKFVTQQEAIDDFSTTLGGQICAVKQHFTSTFCGEALLIFPEQQSLALVRHVLGGLIDENGMTELEQETMTEVGNVVLNACLGSLSDQLDIPITSTFPEYRAMGSVDHLFTPEELSPDRDVRVLVVKVDFHTRAKDISGYLMLVVDIPSAETFLKAIDAFIERIHG
ncbi:MAG: chemotaxis protein CheX, partial [Alphaproteobacteria bacterium]|nr:chemotaxis protein CheX [Alphaproteobacteria bacterium]